MGRRYEAELAEAWSEYRSSLLLPRLEASARRDTAVVHLPDVLGGRCCNRLAVLPPMGRDAPSGSVRVLR